MVVAMLVTMSFLHKCLQIPLVSSPALLDTDYIFSCLAGLGRHNVLADAGIIDGGSVRQFRHSS